jgi:hypothetical protein
MHITQFEWLMHKWMLSILWRKISFLLQPIVNYIACIWSLTCCMFTVREQVITWFSQWMRSYQGPVEHMRLTSSKNRPGQLFGLLVKLLLICRALSSEIRHNAVLLVPNSSTNTVHFSMLAQVFSPAPLPPELMLPTLSLSHSLSLSLYILTLNYDCPAHSILIESRTFCLVIIFMLLDKRSCRLVKV